eukprot:g20809.t1
MWLFELRRLTNRRQELYEQSEHSLGDSSSSSVGRIVLITSKGQRKNCVPIQQGLHFPLANGVNTAEESHGPSDCTRRTTKALKRTRRTRRLAAGSCLDADGPRTATVESLR